MKARCPECGYVTNSPPPTHKCPQCDNFSHDWLIYDWDSFASIQRQHIRYNLAIIGIVLITLVATISLGLASVFKWMIALLIIPATISLFYCRKRLAKRTEYKGHKGTAVFPWFSGFGGL